MKKQLTVIGLILIASIIGVISFWQLALRKYDVSLESADWRVTFTLKGATQEDTWRHNYYQKCFKIAKGVDLYEDYVKDNEYFIGFIDENNNLVEERTNGYLFFKEGYYFYLLERGAYATLYELLGGYYSLNTYGYVVLPYSEVLTYDSAEKISYSDLIGVSCYEDLVEFYSRVDSNKYEIDEENGCIYLSLYHIDRLNKRGAKLTVLEDGIEVELMEEYREKRVE